MTDHHAIGRLLLETGRISKEDYAAAVRESKTGGRSPYEILVFSGQLSVDDLVHAITIHLDIKLLKEAVGMESGTSPADTHRRPLGSYLERISLLFKTGILMSGETRMDAVVELLLREAPSVMNAERATIFLADYDKHELYSHVGVGLTHGQIRIPWDSGIVGWVFSNEQPLNVPEPYSDPRFNREIDAKTGYRTKNLLSVPLRAPGSPVCGVFQVLNKRAGVFTATDLEILEVLASQAGRSIRKALASDNPAPAGRNASAGSGMPLSALGLDDPLDTILGHSQAIRDVRALIRRVAPTETTVLIQGESGTGKELVARAIHRMSKRSDRPLVTLNCSAVPSELIESELFGHKKGSFTGAIADHLGVFRSAHMATLFLDEIEATSPSMQVKLLRAVQVGEIRPVGENRSNTVDVRLITATNQDLGTLIASGQFREDLYYRINVFPITIPPLRERVADVEILVDHFLAKLAPQSGKPIRGMDPAARELLLRYPWPGNVRELENEIERSHVLTEPGAGISVGKLSPRIAQSVERLIEEAPDSDERTLKQAVEELELKMIRRSLEKHGGKRTAVAQELGLSRQGLLNKIYKYGLG